MADKQHPPQVGHGRVENDFLFGRRNLERQLTTSLAELRNALTVEAQARTELIARDAKIVPLYGRVALKLDITIPPLSSYRGIEISGLRATPGLVGIGMMVETYSQNAANKRGAGETDTTLNCISVAVIGCSV